MKKGFLLGLLIACLLLTGCELIPPVSTVPPTQPPTVPPTEEATQPPTEAPTEPVY